MKLNSSSERERTLASPTQNSQWGDNIFSNSQIQNGRDRGQVLPSAVVQPPLISKHAGGLAIKAGSPRMDAPRGAHTLESITVLAISSELLLALARVFLGDS